MSQKADKPETDQAEADRLRDEVVRRMANTPPKQKTKKRDNEKLAGSFKSRD